MDLPVIYTAILSGAKTKILGKTLDFTWKQSVDFINKLLEDSAVEKAIEETVETFSDLLKDGVEAALKKWVLSQEFKDVLVQLENGKKLDTQDLVGEFLRISEFSTPENQDKIAEEILSKYGQNLHKEFLISEEGSFYHDQLEEYRYITIMQKLTDIEKVRIGDSTSKSIPPEENEYIVKLDTAKKLFDDGHLKAAEQIFNEIKEKNRTINLSSQLQFKVFTNLAACKLNQGDVETACSYIETAYNLDPDNPIAVFNKAMSFVTQDNPEKAYQLLKEQLVKYNDNGGLASIYIRTAKRTARESELSTYLLENTWVYEDKECLMTLADNAIEDNNLAEGEQFLRRGFEKDPENTIILISLSNILLLEIQKEEFPWWNVPNNIAEKIIEAEELLTKAITNLEKNYHKYQLHTSLVSRAAVYKMLHRYQEGIADCNRVLNKDPKDPIALQNKGLILWMMDKHVEAIAEFENIDDDQTRDNILLPLADCYLTRKKPEKAIEILEPALYDHLKEKIVFPISSILLQAYHEKHNKKGMQHIIDLLKTIWDGTPELIMILARKKKFEGNHLEAISILEKAISDMPSQNKGQIALEVATLYFKTENYEKAKQIYEPIVDKSTDNPILRNYLISLFNSDDYPEALEISKKLRGDGSAIPIITEIEARIYEAINDLSESKKLRLILAENEPDNPYHLIQLAHLDLRMFDKEAAIRTVESIPYNLIKNNASYLINIAQLRLLLGLSGYLELAYRARRLDYQNAETHLAYLNFCHYSEQRSPQNNSNADGDLPHFPETVEKNCTVKLQNQDGMKFITILDNNDDLLNAETGEVRESDATAKKLLGLKKGDTVVLREGPLETLSYHIEEILSKYTYAFQKIILEFSTMFPNNNAIQRFKIEGNDFSPFFHMFDERYRSVSITTNYYRNNQIPLGMYAKVIGCSLIDIWQDMVNMEQERILCFYGNMGQLGKLDLSDIIVLDVLSILTLSMLDILDKFLDLPLRKIIPQSVLDELNEKIFIINETRSRITMGKSDIGYYSVETKPDVIQTEKAFFQKIVQKLVNARDIGKLEVLPVNYALEYGIPKYKNLAETIGKSSLEAGFITKEQNGKLYSDDQLLRDFVKNEAQVEGIWIYNILALLQRLGKIDNNEFYEHLIKLVLSNYTYIPVDANLLLLLLTRNEFVITREVNKVFAVTFSKCSEDSVIRVLSEFLCQVFSDHTILTRHKGWVLDLSLNILTKNRRSSYIIPKFRRTLAMMLGKQNNTFKAIIENINIWQKHNILT